MNLGPVSITHNFSNFQSCRPFNLETRTIHPQYESHCHTAIKSLLERLLNCLIEHTSLYEWYDVQA